MTITMSGWTIDGERITHCGTAVEEGRKVRVFTLASKRKVYAPVGESVPGAERVRRNLPAGQVRTPARVELIDAVRHGQTRREGAGLASRRRP